MSSPLPSASSEPSAPLPLSSAPLPLSSAPLPLSSAPLPSPLASYYSTKSIPDPSSVNLVLYHDNCPDGFGAAFAAWKRLGSRAEYIGCSHGSNVFPNVTNRTVVILDFSFKFNVLQEMIRQAHQLLIIDHHKSAEEDLQNIPDRYKIFDMNQSGATLAWKFFHRNLLVPPILCYVEDRDLWAWKLNHAEEVCLGLDTVPQTFAEWDKLLTPEAIKQLKAKGEVVASYRDMLVDGLIPKSTRCELGGFVCQVVNVNAPPLVSKTCSALLAKYNVPVALAWYFDYADKQFRISLRSIPGVDCSQLAKRYGGGGHKQSCGFSIALDPMSPHVKEFVTAVLCDLPELLKEPNGY